MDIHALKLWRDAHERSEMTVMELRAKIFGLERRCEGQDAQMNQMSTVAALQKKRKRVVTELTESSNNTFLKQARTTATAQPEDTFLSVSMNEWEDSAPGTYSKMLFAVQKKLESDMLATTLPHNDYLLQEIRSQQFVAILSKVFTETSCMIFTITPSTATENSINVNPRNSTTQAQNQSASIAQTDLDSKLNSKLQAIACIYRRLLERGDISDRTPAGKALQSKVVYSFVKLFRDLLDRIGDLAASHITHNTSKDAQNVSKEAKTAFASAKDDKTTSELCRLLITMAASLEVSNLMHQNIIDGLLFFLLTRVGQLLFVFSDDIQAQNKTTTSHLFQGNFVPEGPHLIFLLTHLTPLIRSASLVLAKKAKMTLQHTLLNAVFGAQTGDFVHALREPYFPPDNLDADADADVHTLASRDDGNVRDWYKHEIWRCLGWEVLADHIAWPEVKV